MKISTTVSIIFTTIILFLTAGCSPSGNAVPTVDVIGTTALELARMMLTQTAGAATATPLPATVTPLPVFTETPTIQPTSAATGIPEISTNTACYSGPGTNYSLVSNVVVTEQVEVVGIASDPDWYVIRNPYFGSLCWVPKNALAFTPDFDLSSLPTIP